MRKHVVILLALLALGFAQETLSPAKWSAKVDPQQLAPGSKGAMKITVALDPDWHLYSLTQPPPPRGLRLKLEDSPVFTQAGDPSEPTPKVQFDPNFQIDTKSFEGTVTFSLPFAVAANAPMGKQTVTAKVTYQVCNSERCLRPTTIPVSAEVAILAAAALKTQTSPTPSPKLSPSPAPTATASVTPTPTPSPESTPVVALSQNSQVPTAQALKARGLMSYIWFALGFGFLALLTPCVFPMIPITVSFFTKRENQSPTAAVGQALIYCAGIVLTFTVLGLLLTLIAGPAGINRLAASPWMNLFLTTLFVVFALNLFGMFEIRLPSGILSKLDSKAQGGSSLIATLLMGLTFTLTSFTCTAAFVGTVLVAATQGDWFWAAIGMFAFATAFASPFFLLALFPRWLHSLPKSGGWLNSVKVVMGFLEIAAAFKFLSNVDLVWGWQTVSRTMVLAAWVALAIVTAIYLLGKIQLPYDTKLERLGVVRMLSATFFLGLAFYLLTGLFGGKLGELDAFLPPDTVSAASTMTAGSVIPIRWIESYDAGLAKAKAEKKPMFLNFTGVTCTNCRWMEQNMFPQPDVKKELDRFVLVELFTDRETPEDERNGQMLETRFKTVALPLYVILDSEGNELSQFPGLTRNRDEFVAFLQAGATRVTEVASRQ